MKSILAILAGFIFIVVASLIMQLAYVLLAVEYNELAKSFAVLNKIRGSFRYLLGMPIFILIMFIGGVITADIVTSRVLVHCFIVGLISVASTMRLALENTELTLAGVMLSLLAISITMLGGLYWRRGTTLNTSTE